MKIKSVEFVKSAAKINQLPELKLTEIAFIGRSNVGKSSLINALCQRKKIVRISKRPGTTQLLNFFLINNEFYFVDLPGYGFAKVSVTEKNNWANLIENYLLHSEKLLHIYLLVDSRHGVTKHDETMLDFLIKFDKNFSIIATKRDKLSNNEWFKIEKLLKKQLQNRKILPVSVLNKNGLDEIYKSISDFIGVSNENRD